MLKLFVLLTFLMVLGQSVSPGQAPTQTTDQAHFFETRIRPMLAQNCFACHTTSRLGGLQLNTRAALLQGGNSGPALVPGRPEASLLIQVVSHTHERLKMPPAGQLKPEEIADLIAWVKAGAYWPETTAPISTAPRSGGYIITPEQRAFWSFQPIRRPARPKVKAKAWPNGELDYFILAQLEERGLKPVAPARKRTWLRRATIDLTGLPPTPEEVAAFLQDSAPTAYAKVIDRLLASPRYGERWGRHWLDVARYSDDKLAPEQDTPYPNAFRYRDWVIKALNDDLPYDLFIKAQIAGDLLATPNNKEANKELVAGLGFYALSPEFQDDRVDATTRGFLGLTVACAQCHDHKYDPIPTKDYYSLLGVFTSTELTEVPLAEAAVVTTYKEHKQKVDEQEAAIKAFIHAQATQLSEILAQQTSKYLRAAWQVNSPPKQPVATVAQQAQLDEELLQRWVNYLNGKNREHPYLKDWDELWQRGGSASEVEKLAGEFQRLIVVLNQEKKAIDQQNLITLGGSMQRRDLSQANLRSLERDKYFLWRDLFAEANSSGRGGGILYFGASKIDRFLHGQWQAHLTALEAELAELKRTMPPAYPFLQTIRDTDKPANLRVYVRGDKNNLGEEAPRRFLSILCDDEPAPFTKGSGRLELAEAIASPRNPLTARVIVNRLWQQHFGQGLVRTPSNFGQLGERPTHPALLDYLASRLIENKWSLKALHREIMLSATYGLSAAYSAQNFAADPDNKLFWRAHRRRLEIEALRDSLLFVAGQLDLTMGGPPQALTEENKRRTVYGFVSRRKLDGLLALFDFPNPNNTSEARVITNVPLQRLFFLNSGFIRRQAEALVRRLTAAGRPDDRARIQQAYRLLFSREATPTEIQLGLDYLRQEKQDWTDYAQVLLSSNEFLFW